MKSNTIICSECGCPYDVSRRACPECGNPNTFVAVATDIQGYSAECSCCGAPSNGLRICQWCGSAIQYVGTSQNSTTSNNKTILECEFRRVANDRNLYPYIICHVYVNGHELLQLTDDGSQKGLTLNLLGVFGLVQNNYNSYPGSHSFFMVQNGVYSRSFGIDYSSAAMVADEVLRQVYEVTSEQVSCNFEYGQNRSEGEGNVAAAALGGVILGAFLDNL